MTTTTPLASLSASGASTVAESRQKRVLPARSRRGGPGIGTCDADIMILETLKRKAETDPIIPAQTNFLLTTDSRLVSPSPLSFEEELRTLKKDRYLERPDVVKAFREEEIIQTPEFSVLSPDAGVGGRFRPRGSEDESADTSDAVYEKRHRKYEMFEKRQRLREKEKLKHEQYKLKERIEQLRAMDATAFLTLPTSAFSTFDGASSETNGDEQAESLTAQSGGQLNGGLAYIEGERRRKEMLDVALSLEERYRVLLPKEKPGGRADVSTDPDLELGTPGREYVESLNGVEHRVVEIAQKETEKIKLRIKFPARDLSAASPSKKKPRSQTVNSPSTSYDGAPDGTLSADEDSIPHYHKRFRRVQDALGPRIGGGKGHYFGDHNSMTASSPRQHTPLSTTKEDSSNGSGRKAEYQPGVLMVAAVRASSAPKSRKTQRHVTAFGVKVPAEIEHIRDFELPYWIRHDDDDEDVAEFVRNSSLEGDRWMESLLHHPEASKSSASPKNFT